MKDEKNSKPLDLEEIKTKVLKEFVETTFGFNEPTNLLLKTLDNKENKFTERELLALLLDLYDNVIDEVKQRIKSKCEFYLRYKDDPEELVKDYPEFKVSKIPLLNMLDEVEGEIALKVFIEMIRELSYEEYLRQMDEYNTWLFKLAFKDVIVAKGKDEATGEAVDVTSRRQAHYNTKNQSDEGKTRANEGD